MHQSMFIFFLAVLEPQFVEGGIAEHQLYLQLPFQLTTSATSEWFDESAITDAGDESLPKSRVRRMADKGTVIILRV